MEILADDERWTHLRRCLTDTTLPGDVRCAGALNLLYGIPLSRTAQLGTSDLIIDGDLTYLLLSAHRLRVAPPVALLLRSRLELAQARETRWLFPGAQPGRHVSTALGHKLRRHGLPPADSARASALISLAAELPAAVLADLLGISIHTAERWAEHARYDWSQYLAARAAGTDPET